MDISMDIHIHGKPGFRTTFNFEREYLWNGWIYRQAANGVINYRPSRVEQKKFGELRSTNDNG